MHVRYTSLPVKHEGNRQWMARERHFINPSELLQIACCRCQTVMPGKELTLTVTKLAIHKHFIWTVEPTDSIRNIHKTPWIPNIHEAMGKGGRVRFREGGGGGREGKQ